MTKLVLIVEDSETIVPLEIALASLNGVNLRLFSNGRDAIEFLHQSSAPPDAIITDLHLPFVDGFALVEKVRADNRYAQLPILVVSGDGDPDTPGRLRALGVNAFFTKPYSPAKVRDALEALLHVD